MKQLFLLCLAVVLALAVTACGGQRVEETTDETKTTEDAGDARDIQAPVEEDESLANLRVQIETTGNLMGVAYLGGLSQGGQEAYGELILDHGYLDAYPFLGYLDWEDAAINRGMEVYCVVARDRDAEVTVQEWICDESNAFKGEPGKTLYQRQSGEPVLLMGNVSDIIPNLLVTVKTADGETLEYSPCLSLCDGTLDRDATPGVYDFSIYYDSEPAQGAPA